MAALLTPSLDALIHELGNVLALTMSQAEHLLQDEGVDDPAQRRESLVSIRSSALRARELMYGIRTAATSSGGAARDPRLPSIGGVLGALANALVALEVSTVHLSARAGHLFIDAPPPCEGPVAPAARPPRPSSAGPPSSAGFHRPFPTPGASSAVPAGRTRS